MKNKFICTVILSSVIFLSYVSAWFADVLSDAVIPLTTPASTSISTTLTNSYRTLNIPGSPQQSTISTEIGMDGKKTGNLITKTIGENGETLIEVKNEKTGDISFARSESNGEWSGDAVAIGAGNNLANASKKLATITSEKVPWATCVCKDTKNSCNVVETRKYECTTDSWMLWFQSVFAQIIRYVINIVLLLGVLAVVWLGIAWSFAGWDDVKMKSNLKSWAINIIIGLIILFMFRYILLFLAPWVYN